MKSVSDRQRLRAFVTSRPLIRNVKELQGKGKWYRLETWTYIKKGRAWEKKNLKENIPFISLILNWATGNSLFKIITLYAVIIAYGEMKRMRAKP